MTTSEEREVPVDPAAPTTPTTDTTTSGPFEAREGAVLADKFELQRPLGKGGMGTVWVAKHLALKSPVAIKLIDAKIAGDQLATERFVREAQSAANLRGRNVVQILDYGVDRNTPYIAMELLEGESLAARLDRERKLDAATTAVLMADVGRAAGRAHDQGIVHRDLKPDNIFIVHDGEAELAKVLDFGIAKAPSELEESKVRASTDTGALLGTPYYMSPEQAKDSKKADPRSDIWAIGVIAFECLVGRRPFKSDQITDLVLQICTEPLPVPSEFADVPPGFDAWFVQACARKVDERFQTTKEAIVGLRTALGAVTPSVSMSSPVESSGRPMWLGVAVAAVVVLGGFVLFRGGDEDPAPPASPTPTNAAIAQADPVPTPTVQPDPTPAKDDPPPPEPAQVEITFEGGPPAAEVFLGDERLGTTDAPIVLARGPSSKTLRIVARGHRDGSVVIVPSQDLTIPVSLEAMPEPRKPKPKPKPKPEAKAGGEKPPEVSF